MRIILSLFLSLCALDFCWASHVFPTGTLYGEDNRADISTSYGDVRVLRWASSVALVINKEEVRESVCDRSLLLSTVPLGLSRSLCQDEPFYYQGTAGFCTGFLISPKHMLTAGHCLKSRKSCETLRFLFDYQRRDDSRPLSLNDDRVLTRNLFSCKKVVYWGGEENSDLSLDLAIIELDREALGRGSLELESASELSYETELLIAGHPLGLPLKVSSGGFPLSFDGLLHFSASLDSFSGNSGSPVINRRSGKVEGILLGGGRDFVLKGDCFASAHCDSPLCPGEKVLRSTVILAQAFFASE